MRIGQLEIFLILVIIFTLVYLANAYIGFLVCLILGSISVALLLLSFIFEIIDRSKVPKEYYLFMFNAALAAFIVLIAFSLFLDGSFDWMNQ